MAKLFLMSVSAEELPHPRLKMESKHQLTYANGCDVIEEILKNPPPPCPVDSSKYSIADYKKIGKNSCSFNFVKQIKKRHPELDEELKKTKEVEGIDTTLVRCFYTSDGQLLVMQRSDDMGEDIELQAHKLQRYMATSKHVLATQKGLRIDVRRQDVDFITQLKEADKIEWLQVNVRGSNPFGGDNAGDYLKAATDAIGSESATTRFKGGDFIKENAAKLVENTYVDPEETSALIYKENKKHTLRFGLGYFSATVDIKIERDFLSGAKKLIERFKSRVGDGSTEPQQDMGF